MTILPRAGRVVFANNDKTKHQVYSFSPIKQFEITLAQGERSPSFAFDKAGVAVLGCNIHDHMIAYVFVSDSPWTALTGPDGRTVIADVPPGNLQRADLASAASARHCRRRQSQVSSEPEKPRNSLRG